ncbi:DUF4439 domain-containing protein [Nocardioides sp.]|uniref:DUF4439 domain-containing protein n=1 Tax=Nocardioides sp. TaxID=35761 RepID=UPI003561DFC8
MSPVAALQTALEAEHAALYLHGVLGARTSAAGAPALFRAVSAAYDAHRGQRDALRREIEDLGAEPVAAAPAYEAPGALGGPSAVAAAALEVERAVARTYAWLVTQSSGETRRRAIGALTQTAVRELSFRGAPEMLPGADEFANR